VAFREHGSLTGKNLYRIAHRVIVAEQPGAPKGRCQSCNWNASVRRRVALSLQALPALELLALDFTT
jgi:hypothetical protein